MSHHKEKYVFKRQSYFRLLSYVKKYKLRLTIGIVAGFVTGGSLFGSFFWVKPLTDPMVKAPQVAAAEGTPAVEAPVVDKKSQLDVVVKVARKFGVKTEDAKGNMTREFLFLLVFSFVALWFLKNFATYINRYFMRWVGTRVVADLRDEVFNKLLRQSLVFYGKADIGQLISRCTNDTASIESAVSNCIADASRCPFEILGCFGFIVFTCYTRGSFALPIIIIVAALLVILPLIMVGKLIRKRYRSAYQRIAEVVSRMHEVFTGILTVKAYHMEQRETDYFKRVNDKYFRKLVSALRAELMMSPLMEFVGVVAVAAFVVYSYLNSLLLTDIVALLLPALLAYEPIKNLAKVNTYIQRSMAAADRYFDLLDNNTELVEALNPISIKSFQDRVKFDNVKFCYEPGGHLVLKGVSFELPRGHMVAVVGETGSGKTTIANLIARFYDAVEGAVSIDGHDVRNLRVADLRHLVGIVTQDPVLFNDSIANNIAYGCPDATRDEVMAAAKRANAHDFIVDGRHPEGYDTVVGEKGWKLSGGEKQRLSIARAILKNPPILILDEATSALDTVTEKLVQDALDKLMENRTVFAIAHRLSTIQHAENILVLEKGKIIESGSHAALMALEDGRYRKLSEIQFGSKERKNHHES